LAFIGSFSGWRSSASISVHSNTKSAHFRILFMRHFYGKFFNFLSKGFLQIWVRRRISAGLRWTLRGLGLGIYRWDCLLLHLKVLLI
jgi:hypothetical protein